MRASKLFLLELFRFYHKRLVKYHPLRCLIWECTLNCNLSCKHCGSDCERNHRFRDMPLSDFLSVLDTIKSYIPPSQLKITLSGGEPLMRSDIVECGKALSQLGYSWGMVSNGLLLTKQKIAELVTAGMRSISLSLDGIEDYHNSFRGNPYSYKRVVEAIMELKKYPRVFISVVTCVTPNNITQLDSLKNLLFDALKVNSWRLYPVFPIGRAASDNKLLLQSEQLKELLTFIQVNRDQGYDIKFSCEGFLGDFEGKVRQHFYYCMAGVSVASIRSNGDISGCNSIRYNYAEGNIYKDSFIDVWQKRFKRYRNRSWAKTGICSKCNMFRYCLGGGMHLRNGQGEIVNCLYLKLKEGELSSN